MAISVNYILEQERLKKQQQAQQVPGVEPLDVKDKINPTNLQDQFNPSTLEQKYQQKEPESHNLHDRVMAKSPLQSNYEQGQSVEEQIAEPPKAPRPAGFENYDDGQYEAISTFMTPEQMEAVGSKNPDALMSSMQQNIYRNSARQPQDPYQDKSYNKSRKFAAIGDVLSLASQVAGAAMGAQPRERKFEESAMGRQSERQQQLYNRYLQESDQYSRGLVNAQIQDYIQGKRDWKDTQALLNKTLSDYNKEQIAAAKEAQRIEQADKKAAIQQEQFDKRMDQTERRMDMQEKQQNRSIAAINRREDRLDRQYDNKTDPNNKEDKLGAHIVVPAHPNDPNATVDEFGTRIAIVPISNERKTTYGREAISNTDFMARHPEYALPYDKTAHTSTQLRDIGEAYVQELYNKQFETQSTTTNNIPPGVAVGGLGDKGLTAPNTQHRDSVAINIDEEFPIVL